MNYEAAIAYAHQRMREIGKKPCEYHWETVLVYPTESGYASGKFSISAYNELYILINHEKYYGVFVLSDNSAFNSDEPIETGVQEFTGVIRFTKLKNPWYFDPVDTPVIGSVKRGMEFLRVVIY